MFIVHDLRITNFHKPSKAWLWASSWHQEQFFPATTPSPYLNTARSVARKEIAPGTQVRKS
jgi:hypothetical protein